MRATRFPNIVDTLICGSSRPTVTVSFRPNAQASVASFSIRRLLAAEGYPTPATLMYYDYSREVAPLCTQVLEAAEQAYPKYHNLAHAHDFALIELTGSERFREFCQARGLGQAEFALEIRGDYMERAASNSYFDLRSFLEEMADPVYRIARLGKTYV